MVVSSFLGWTVDRINKKKTANHKEKNTTIGITVIQMTSDVKQTWVFRFCPASLSKITQIYGLDLSKITQIQKSGFQIQKSAYTLIAFNRCFPNFHGYFTKSDLYRVRSDCDNSG